MVLDYAREHGAITRTEAAQLCQIGGPQASRVLSRVFPEDRAFQTSGRRTRERYVWEERQQ